MRWWDGITGHEFEQALEVGDGQGSLACYSLWVRKAKDNAGKTHCKGISSPKT